MSRGRRAANWVKSSPDGTQSIVNDNGVSEGRLLTAWRVGSYPAIVLPKAYYNVKAVSVFHSESKPLRQVANPQQGFIN